MCRFVLLTQVQKSHVQQSSWNVLRSDLLMDRHGIRLGEFPTSSDVNYGLHNTVKREKGYKMQSKLLIG